MVRDLADLEMLSVELNTIIESTGHSLDRVSIKTTESKNMADTANQIIEQATRRRRRARKTKTALALLLIAICVITGAYFGTKILDFLIRIKKVVK